MSHLEVTQQLFAAFGTGDIPTILGLVADDVAWEQWPSNSAQAAGLPTMLARHGKAGVAEFFAAVGSLEVHDFQIHRFMEGPDAVAVELTFEATPPGGQRYRDEELILFNFDEAGKITRLRHYIDTAKQMKAWNLG